MFGEHALFQGKLFFMGHVLNTAAATTAEIIAGRCATHFAGAEDTFSARLDHLAACIEHPRFDFLAGQTAGDEPGLAVQKGNAAPVIGQPLDAQPLLFTGRNLHAFDAAGRLKAQTSFMLGHQLGKS